MKTSIILLIIIMTIFISDAFAETDKLLEKGRNLYYSSVKKEDDLEEAIKVFQQIKKQAPNQNALSTTYIGSLTMLKGKHAFWPQTKIKFVNEGIEIMEKGYSSDKKNIELLFIFGSSCHYLPGFLGKGDLAEEKLREIIPLLNENSIFEYKKDVMKGALEFLLKELELSQNEKSKLNNLLNKINA